MLSRLCIPKPTRINLKPYRWQEQSDGRSPDDRRAIGCESAMGSPRGCLRGADCIGRISLLAEYLGGADCLLSLPDIRALLSDRADFGVACMEQARPIAPHVAVRLFARADPDDPLAFLELLVDVDLKSGPVGGRDRVARDFQTPSGQPR